MAIKFHARLSDARRELFIVARGDDRPNIISEVTGFLEAEGLYVASIGFNLTSPEQNQFSMEIVARGSEAKLEKCCLAFDSNWMLPEKKDSDQKYPKIRWARAWMFHIGLNTPDRAGIVAAISTLVGKPHPEKAEPNSAVTGSFVHLLGTIDNSGDSAQGGTPYFSLRANVATETRQIRDVIIEQLKQALHNQGFSDDLWIIPLDRPGRT